jgi:hypothetical protein
MNMFVFLAVILVVVWVATAIKGEKSSKPDYQEHSVQQLEIRRQARVAGKTGKCYAITEVVQGNERRVLKQRINHKGYAIRPRRVYNRMFNEVIEQTM